MSNQIEEQADEYAEALKYIDDITPYIVLVTELDKLSKERRINEMRRTLVRFHAKQKENWEKEARVHENQLHLARFYAASLTEGSSIMYEAVKPVFESRLAHLSSNKPNQDKEG